MTATAAHAKAQLKIHRIVRMWTVLAIAMGTLATAADFNERVLEAGRLYRQGDYSGAETILIGALKETDSFSPGDPRRAIVLNNLGSVYQYMNRYTQAEQCYRRAVDIEAKLWGTGEDKPFRSTLNLAALYIETGQYEKAERLELRSLAEQPSARRNDGDFARLLLLIGDLEEHQGRYAKAQECDEKALTIFEKLAPDGRQAMETLNGLCVLYQASRRNVDALSYCERSLKIAEGLSNLEPSMQALLQANVGTLQFLVHGSEQAEPFYSKALAVAETGLGPKHPLLGRILLSYADFLERTKRQGQAKQFRRRAKAILAADTDVSRKYSVDLSDLLKGQSRR